MAYKLTLCDIIVHYMRKQIYYSETFRMNIFVFENPNRLVMVKGFSNAILHVILPNKEHHKTVYAFK